MQGRYQLWRVHFPQFWSTKFPSLLLTRMWMQSSHFTYRNDAYKSHSADIWMKGRHRHGHLVNTMKQMCRRHLQWVSSRALDYIGAPLDLPNQHVAVVDQSTDDLSKGDGHLTLTRRVGNWKFHQIIKVSFLIIKFSRSSFLFLEVLTHFYPLGTGCNLISVCLNENSKIFTR